MNIPPEPFFFFSNSPFLRMLTNQFSGLNWQPLLSLFFILLLIGAYYFVHEFIVSIFQSTTIIQTSDSHQTIIYGKILDTLFNIFPIRNSPQQNIWMNKIMLYPIDPFFKNSIQKTKGRFDITYYCILFVLIFEKYKYLIFNFQNSNQLYLIYNWIHNNRCDQFSKFCWKTNSCPAP